MPQKSSAKARRASRKEARDLDVKISFLEGLVKRDHDYVEALELLGDCYSRRGQFPESLRVDERLSKLEPGNPLVFYNLGCSYALNQKYDLAAGAIEKALALGFCDFKWLANDPDLRQLRKLPVFRAIKDKIQAMKVKVG